MIDVAQPVSTTARTVPARAVRTGWLLGVLLVGQLMTTVDATIVNVAAPTVRADLATTGAALQFVVSGYFLTYAMLLITGARLGVTLGARRLFLLGLVAFTAASLLCGLAPSAPVLVVARLLQGAGAAVMVPQVLTGIQVHFAGAERARALGWYVASLSGGSVLGQVLGGVLVTANLWGLSWRPIFLLNVPIGVAALLLGRRVLPADEPGTRVRTDAAGVTLLSVAVLLLALPLVLGSDQGWPAWAVASLALAVVAFAAFVLVERAVARRGGHPLVDLGLLTRRTVSWGLVGQAAGHLTYVSLLFVLALYLQQGLGRSPLAAGLALVSWVAAFGVAGLVLRRLPARLRRLAGPGGYLLLALAYLGLAATAYLGVTGAPTVLLLGLGGYGFGTGFSTVLGRITGSVDTRHAADVSGAHATLLQVMGVLGVATFGSLYLALAGSAASGPAVAGTAFAGTATALAALALVATLAAARTTRAS